MKNSFASVFSIVILACTLAITACTKEEAKLENDPVPEAKTMLEDDPVPEAKTNRIVISYVRPENPEFLHIYTLLKDERRTLEKLQEVLSPFLLSWTLTIELAECDGEADAMYEDDTVTICYEYVDELWDLMPEDTSEAGIEPIDTVIGPFLDSVLHEFAHALFDLLDIPVLGREEDAADQVSAYIYLKLGRAEARRLIVGTVYAYILEVEDTDPPSMDEFADEHSTTEQRRFNLLCMAYGSDPELFEEVAVWGGLPDWRADICIEEYELIEYAYETLIGPHIDPVLRQKIYGKSWLPDETSRILEGSRPGNQPAKQD